jgi:hypothetical protein
MSKPARLPNTELEFIENNIAAALSIVGKCKALAYEIDDPESLELVLSILKKAQFIRRANINWCESRKENLA